MDPRRSGYGTGSSLGLNFSSLDQGPDTGHMASFYELLNQAHESNVRRGFHNAPNQSDKDGRSSLNTRTDGSMPKNNAKGSLKDSRNKSANTLSRSKSKGSKVDKDDEETEYKYANDPNATIEANLAKSRSSEKHAHYQDVPNGNHFGNLGAELHSLKRQLALNQTTMERAMK